MTKHPQSKKQDNDLLVIGLGASAGGLEALEAFFKAMPDSKWEDFTICVRCTFPIKFIK